MGKQFVAALTTRQSSASHCAPHHRIPFLFPFPFCHSSFVLSIFPAPIKCRFSTVTTVRQRRSPPMPMVMRPGQVIRRRWRRQLSVCSARMSCQSKLIAEHLPQPTRGRVRKEGNLFPFPCKLTLSSTRSRQRERASEYCDLRKTCVD